MPSTISDTYTHTYTHCIQRTTHSLSNVTHSPPPPPTPPAPPDPSALLPCPRDDADSATTEARCIQCIAVIDYSSKPSSIYCFQIRKWVFFLPPQRPAIAAIDQASPGRPGPSRARLLIRHDPLHPSRATCRRSLLSSDRSKLSIPPLAPVLSTTKDSLSSADRLLRSPPDH